MLHVMIVIVVAMLVLSAFGCAAPVSPAPPIRVMCFNIRCSTATGDGENHWSKRRELFFQTVERLDPDLLGAQEAVSEQADALRARLADEYTFIGVGRDDGERRGEFAPILFRADRFELLDQGHIWLSESPEKPGSVSWDSALTRIATWVKLRDKLNPTRGHFIFMNTHWDHVGELARLESAKLIRRTLAKLSDHGKLGVIFAGDLNCTEDQPPLLTLLGTENGGPTLSDSYRAVHPRAEPMEQTFHAFDGSPVGRRIDFIMHTPHWRCGEAVIDRSSRDGRYPSDHFPVICVLDWSNR
ncbi:MAG: endonuclease/exonuclease/phosphatase family protein [Anaerolineae bacterium]|nr:endonuclease/exonuclease/phosphatase family protein [Phycisphaerae bacterium]